MLVHWNQCVHDRILGSNYCHDYGLETTLRNFWFDQKMSSQAKSYYKNIDALRTFACVLVFMQHGLANLVIPNFSEAGFINETIKRLFSAGDIGVSLFFVLSGFLITDLLLVELNEKDRIEYGRFFRRRCLRIWPVYYVVVTYAIIIYPLIKQLIGIKSQIEIGNPLLYFVFLGNFDVIHLGSGHGAGSTNITWSVAIEQQFYFMWPFLIYAFRKHLPLLFTAVIIISHCYCYMNMKDEWAIYFHTLSNMSFITTGAILAYLKKIKWTDQFIFLNRIAVTGIYFFGFLFVFYSHFLIPSHLYFLRNSLHSIYFAFVIFNQNDAIHSPIKLSNFRLCSNVAKFTYGFYLYHPICLALTSLVVNFSLKTMNSTLQSAIIAAIGLVTSCLVSYLSYYYFERYFLNLK